jgi:hypothetical protein
MASGSCASRQQVEHMAAPTEVNHIKKGLANGEPSTHGAFVTSRFAATMRESNRKRKCEFWGARRDTRAGGPPPAEHNRNSRRLST